MLQCLFLCTYLPPKHELQKGNPDGTPSMPAHGLGTAVQAAKVHVHTHSGHAFPEGSHTTSLLSPP